MKDSMNLDAEGAKAAAVRLRKRLADLGVELNHGMALEALSAVVGDPSWNVTAARLGNASPSQEETLGDDGTVPVIWFSVDEARDTISLLIPDITLEETKMLLEAYVADRTPAEHAKSGHWNARGIEDLYRTNMMDVWLEEVFLPGDLGSEPEELGQLRARMSAPRPS